MATQLMIVGGFLGAGKTTMLGQLAKKLSDQGKKVGLITNDQASGLVDTHYLSSKGGSLREVSGSCFCCNFDGFTEAITALINDGMDMIIAEPVGSCTDLSATIMQPLKEFFSDRLTILPLSALCDVNRAKDILAGGNSGLHESAAYIVRKQLEEADIIVINKKDLVSETEIEEIKAKACATWTEAKGVFAVSGLNDSGLEAWLDELQKADFTGTHILTDIDYDVYAEGEAVLGWLNTTIDLKGNNINWKDWLNDLMTYLGKEFDNEEHAIGHMKAMIMEPSDQIIANIVGNLSTLMVRGNTELSPEVTLVFNARVEMSPEALADACKKALEKLTEGKITYEIHEWNCLMPGRPNPTHRYNKIV